MESRYGISNKYCDTCAVTLRMASHIAGRLIAANYRFKNHIPQLKRLILCYNNIRPPRGITEFINHHLSDFAQSHKYLSIYTLEVCGSNHLIAEYLNGTEKKIDLSKMTLEDIQKQVNLLTTNSGLDWKKSKIRKKIYTHQDSTQGIWSADTRM